MYKKQAYSAELQFVALKYFYLAIYFLYTLKVFVVILGKNQ